MDPRASDGGKFSKRRVRDDLGGGAEIVAHFDNPWNKSLLEWALHLVLLRGLPLVKCSVWPTVDPVTLTTVNRALTTDGGMKKTDGLVHTVFIGYATRVARPKDTLFKVTAPGMFCSGGLKLPMVRPSSKSIEACVKHLPGH